mmetsp:Transcript_14498/g.24746  ORF Transcript_14498/g.24746 Transcript_14498/m.24746 type:complete len:238 (-) Transcript_14498:391-1104(-)
MEEAKYALSCCSGMAAIIGVLSLLQHGDIIITIDDLYSGTQMYLDGILVKQANLTWIKHGMTDLEDLEKVLTTQSRVPRIVWVESPTNPTMKCVDIQAIAKICASLGCLFVVDNTFMSPVLQNPVKLGADIVMHSITKYIGGHSDVVAGALMFNDPDLYDQLYFNIKSIGTFLSPFDAWIALRGTKTLHLRVERASENALQIAKFLEGHKMIEKVLYPGLPSHPHHKIALKNRSKNT